MYIPKQRDIVWIDFDPSKGKEIKKRRPALVISTNGYNRATGFCIVSPITSNTVRSNPTYYTLNEDLATKGQVAVAQIYTMDYSKVANRNIQYIEQLELEDFLLIQQIEIQMFGFKYI